MSFTACLHCVRDLIIRIGSIKSTAFYWLIIGVVECQPIAIKGHGEIGGIFDGISTIQLARQREGLTKEFTGFLEVLRLVAQRAICTKYQGIIRRLSVWISTVESLR